MSEESRFVRLPSGWYRAKPDETAISWALEKERELDAAKPNDFENFSNRRWQGFLAEAVFNRWLLERSVPIVWNGGADPSPDFVVAGIGTGCKSRGYAKAWRPNFVVNMFERHRAHPDEKELFFLAVQRPDDGTLTSAEVLVLGGLPHADYFAQATEIKPGDRLNPNVIAKNHVWNLECRLLQLPDEWIRRVAPSSG